MEYLVWMVIILFISRDTLLAEPVVIDMGMTIHNVVDDVFVRLVVLPGISECGCQKIRLQVDDLGVVYVDFIEEDTGEKSIQQEINNSIIKEESLYEFVF